ncbi:hypothetical protein J5N97_006238 [Dioscorea zingiberensis]|uniref:Uncharacterized protein n=1 Tax=Dioscorea zingiberensis TaxID=325984 RepID=A0A9D5DC11_9LILI|nr:hypothetical protein J5N97_006238 [Dioscorea zingiberensis]
MESRSAADRKQEQSEGASRMPFFQQRQRTTASGRPPRDGSLFKFAQPASQALSPLFSPSEHHHHHDPSSQIHPPGSEPPRDYIKLSTHESHYHLQEKEQLAFPETSLPQINPKREFMGNKQGNAYEGRGLVEIEQLLKQKMFTRDETNCLIELLRSRTIDLPYVDGHASKIEAEAVEARSQRDAITLKPENNAFQPDQVTRNVYDTPQSTDNRAVGSSPVDIAKAYMQALASTSGTENQSGKPRTEKIRCNDDESRLPFSTAINTPTKSQGAVVQGALGYCTLKLKGQCCVAKLCPESICSFTCLKIYFQVSRWTPKS